MALLEIAAYANATTKGWFEAHVRGSGLKLSVYAGAIFEATSNDRRPVSDITVMLGDTANVRKRSSQKCVTTATCDSEFVAFCDASSTQMFSKSSSGRRDLCCTADV